MSTGGALVALAQQALLLALWLALPLLVAALVAGVVSGLLGALTQVQDASIGLVIRVAAIAGALALFAAPLAERLVRFGHQVMAVVERAGQAGG